MIFVRQEIEYCSYHTIDYKRLEKTTQYRSLLVSVVCSNIYGSKQGSISRSAVQGGAELVGVIIIGVTQKAWRL